MPAAPKVMMLILMVSAMCGAMAQKPGASGNRGAAAQQKAKPKFRTQLGNYTDSATVTVDEAEKLVVLPLVITDDKNQVYTISTYQLAYTRLAVTEDEKTGKVTPTTSLVAKQFTATPVPAAWSKFVVEQLKPGEQLYFFDIVAKDAKGKLYFVPELRIKTK